MRYENIMICSSWLLLDDVAMRHYNTLREEKSVPLCIGGIFMPLYEYRCSDCKTKFELLVTRQQADDIICMKCHSDKVRRLLSTFAVPRGGGEDTAYSDDVPMMGGCSCGGGGCGCN